jgi:ankyrin repeat protein
VATAVLDRAPDLADDQNEDGDAPLHQAAFNGHADVVSLLLDRGCSVALRKVDGASALHLAAARGFVGVVRLLLGKGADAASRNAHGLTPRDLSGRHPNVLAAIDEHAATPATAGAARQSLA